MKRKGWEIFKKDAFLAHFLEVSRTLKFFSGNTRMHFLEAAGKCYHIMD